MVRGKYAHQSHGPSGPVILILILVALLAVGLAVTALVRSLHNEDPLPDPVEDVLTGQQQEQQIPQLRMGAPEGPQTVIPQPQQRPQAAAAQKPMGSQSRRGHPNSRCRQPPARDSS